MCLFSSLGFRVEHTGKLLCSTLDWNSTFFSRVFCVKFSEFVLFFFLISHYYFLYCYVKRTSCHHFLGLHIFSVICSLLLKISFAGRAIAPSLYTNGHTLFVRIWYFSKKVPLPLICTRSFHRAIFSNATKTVCLGRIARGCLSKLYMLCCDPNAKFLSFDANMLA